jgi:hypothetical protein
MKSKYWLCKRKGIFFSLDSATGKRESLRTGDREEAHRIVRAKNEATVQPAINIAIAKAYLNGSDPKLFERTWAFVMQKFCSVKKENTRLRRERAIKSQAFSFIRNKRLVETTAEDFYAVLKSGGMFTHASVAVCPSLENYEEKVIHLNEKLGLHREFSKNPAESISTILVHMISPWIR